MYSLSFLDCQSLVENDRCECVRDAPLLVCLWYVEMKRVRVSLDARLGSFVSLKDKQSYGRRTDFMGNNDEQ